MALGAFHNLKALLNFALRFEVAEHRIGIQVGIGEQGIVLRHRNS